MLAKAGVKRCYGIVGDALNPVIDALRRNGKIEFIHVRHEEYGVFAAVAEAYLTGNPVVGLRNGWPGRHPSVQWADGRAQRGSSDHRHRRRCRNAHSWTRRALEELNPYKFFDAASLYTGRLVNPEQARAVITTAILTAIIDKGPTVISIPGDVASADAADRFLHEITIPASPVFRPSDADLNKLVDHDRRREDGGDLRRRWLPAMPAMKCSNWRPN